MIFIRSVIPVLFCILLHQHVHAQQKPDTAFNKAQDSLSLRSKDTDGDGVKDDEDKCINERGPASNFGCPIIDKSMIDIHYPILRSVFFAKSSSHLSTASIEILKTSVARLKEWSPSIKINIEGHTDNIGRDESNRLLSKARVKAVMDYLLSSGIDKSRITYTIYIGQYSIADPTTKAGRAINRRVEFTLYE
jgi:OmpA-OmpF porin, OOP family